MRCLTRTMTAPSAIILAGGRSSRMGLPKAALPFGASTILERLIDALSGGFAEIIVVAAPLSDEPFSIDHALKRRVDVNFETDASGGTVRNFKPQAPHELDYRARRGRLRRARLARSDAAWTGRAAQSPSPVPAICRCCDPIWPLPCARCSSGGAVPETPYDAAIPSIEGFTQPLCAAYRREPAIAALLAMEADDEHRLTRLADRLNVNAVDEVSLRAFDTDLRSFLNVNTADDYARALRLARTA